METLVRLLREATLAAVVAIAPTEVDPWRLDPTPPPARILAVGDPVPALWARARD